MAEPVAGEARTVGSVVDAVALAAASAEGPPEVEAKITEQVIIGTPGTIKKWMSAKKLSTREMKIFIFDEAGHMLAESQKAHELQGSILF